MLAVNSENISVPVLAINSETFHWRQQTDEIKKLFDGLTPQSLFSVLKETAHHSFSDLPILFSAIFRFAGALPKKAKPEESMEWIVQSSVEFINTRLEEKVVEGGYFTNESAEERGDGFLFGDKAFDYIYGRFT
jgi:hypothetical protein